MIMPTSTSTVSATRLGRNKRAKIGPAHRWRFLKWDLSHKRRTGMRPPIEPFFHAEIQVNPPHSLGPAAPTSLWQAIIRLTDWGRIAPDEAEKKELDRSPHGA
jgi:hypothetical protein